MKSPFRRSIQALLLAVSVVGLTQCVDSVTGPRSEYSTFGVTPVWGSRASHALGVLDEGGFPLDRVRVILIRPVNDTVKDTTVALHRSDPEIELPLTVRVTPGVTLDAILQFKSGETLLYEGHAQVETVPLNRPNPKAFDLPMTYVGPGKDATHVLVTPASGTFTTATNLIFTATAFDVANASLPGTPMEWTVNDATMGAFTSGGVFAPSGKSGPVTVTAATPLGIAGSATVNLAAPVATSLTLVSGDGQTGTVQAALAAPFLVKVVDQFGTAMSGVVVTWTQLTGGGSTLTAASTTNAAGQASALYKLGNVPGDETVRASVSGIAATVTFTAHAVAGTSAAIAVVSGSAQKDTVAKALANPFVVKVTDAAGNPLNGVTVNWSRTGGSGTPATATSTTNAQGLASFLFTLGTTAGIETIEASVTGVTPKATFTAEAVASKPASIALVSGSAQTDTVTKALANPFVVKVADQYGNVVSGAAVAWTRTGGTGTPASSSSTTNALGLASLQYTLGPTAGAETVNASVTGVTPQAAFSATAVASKPAAIELVAGNGQIDTLFKTLSNPFMVKVTDAHGNAVGGATVTWTRTAGFGSPNSATSTTTAAGVATLTYRLGDIAGTETVVASVAGVATPVTFTATAADIPPEDLGLPVVTGFAYLRVQPSPVSPRVGDTLTFTVDSVDAVGHATGVTAVWASSNPGRGSINASGRLIVADTGAIIITATRNGLTGHARVSVLPAPMLTGFSFAPKTLAGVTNSPVTASFTFAAFDAGTGVTSATLTLTSPTGTTRTCTFGAPSTGTPRNGAFDCALTVPAGSPTGVWHVTSLVLNGSITRTYGESVLALFSSTTLTINP